MKIKASTFPPLLFSQPVQRTLLALLLCLLLPGMLAQAHEAGVTDTSIQVGHSSLKLVYTLPADELDLLQQESGLSSRQLIERGFVVKNDNKPCDISNFQQKALSNIDSQQFVLLLQCDGSLQNLNLGYSLFNQDNDHQNFVRISIAGRNQNITLSGENTSHNIPVSYLLNLWGKKLNDDLLPGSSPVAGSHSYNSISNNNQETGAFPFTALLNSLTLSSHYFSIGLEHILQGYDHVLFLVGLLLLPLGFRQLLLLASAFTLAHSITLALSVLNVVRLPSALVEAAIAASIIYVALENLWHLRGNKNIDKLVSPWKRRSIMTFLFGLIHGFGFSYLLTEIGLGDQVAAALLYFNLGVEAGQLLIITLVFPVLIYAFKRQQGVMMARLGSVLIGCMGSLWLVERIA